MAALIVGALVVVVILVAVGSAFERKTERRLDDGLAKLATHLGGATRERLGDDYTVRGSLRGLPLVVKLYEEGPGSSALRFTSVQCTRAIDDRFTVSVWPRTERKPGFEGSFLLTTIPDDLARTVFDDATRTALAQFGAPLLRMALGTHELELLVTGYLDSDASIAACELVAKLVEKLDERALMCPRPA